MGSCSLAEDLPFCFLSNVRVPLSVLIVAGAIKHFIRALRNKLFAVLENFCSKFVIEYS